MNIPILDLVVIVAYLIGITVIDNLMTPPSAAQLENACWGSPLKARSEEIIGLRVPRLLSVLFFALMVALHIFLK